MIDIHTHILPGMDDGAADENEAIAMLTLLKKQGISLIVLTPHYYSFDESISDFYERRRLAYRRIADCGFDMLLASETYLSESLFSNDSIDQLLIPNTRYLLLELPEAEKWGPFLKKQINRVIGKYNIRPIIAHIDRYAPLRKKGGSELQELIDMGCLLQINTDSVIKRETRSAALDLIKGGWIDFVGSDCHNLVRRPPQFDQFKNILKKKFNKEYSEYWNL